MPNKKITVKLGLDNADFGVDLQKAKTLMQSTFASMAGQKQFSKLYLDIDKSKFDKNMSLVKQKAAEVQWGLSDLKATARDLFANFSIAAAIAGFGILAKKVFDLTAAYKSAQVSLEVMIGSAGQANTLMQKIQTMANITPFETTDLLDATKVLLAYNEQVGNILPDLQMLGDISGGNAEKLQFLSVAFAQVLGAGRLTGEELRQMRNAGFNPLQQIAKTTGETMGEVTKRMEDGRVSVREVRDAMVEATSEGGRFFNLMNRQSKELSGLTSTLNDGWAALSRTLGNQLEPTAKRVLNVMIGLVNKANNLLQIYFKMKNQNQSDILKEKIITEEKKLGIQKGLKKEYGTDFIINGKIWGKSPLSGVYDATIKEQEEKVNKLKEKQKELNNIMNPKTAPIPKAVADVDATKPKKIKKDKSAAKAERDKNRVLDYGIESQKQISEGQIQIEEEALKHSLNMRKITQKEYLQAEIEIEDKKYQNALLYNEKMSELYKNDKVKYAEIQKEKAEITANYNLEHLKKQFTLDEEIHKKWTQANDDINNSWKNSISGFLSGNATLKDSFSNLFDGIRASFANLVADMAAQKIGKYLFGDAGGGDGIMGLAWSAAKVAFPALNLMPKFADGGIIPGSYSTAVPIIGHGAEMVVNPYQQKRLWSLIQGSSATVNTMQPNQQSQPMTLNHINPVFQSIDPAQGQKMFEQWMRQSGLAMVSGGIKNNDARLRDAIRAT